MFFSLLISVFLRSESYVVPFQLIHNLIVIEATVDQQKGYFILDTGSDAIFMDKSFHDASALSQEFSTLHGSLNAQSFIIKQFSLGSLSKQNLEAFNTRMDNIEAFLSMDIAGIVGTKVFAPHSILFDFTTETLHLIDKPIDSKPFNFFHEIDFSMASGVPSISVQIEDEFYNFILDSGASSHMMDEVLVTKYPHLFESIQKNITLESLGVSASKPASSRYLLNNLLIGNKKLENVRCIVKDFSELNIDNKSPISGLLSLSEIKAPAVLLDFKKMKVYF